MSRGRSSFGASLAAFGLAALFAWAGSASAALSATETTGPVGSVDDRAPAAPTNVLAEANLVDFQGELSWDLSADDFLRQSPAGSDFTSGGTFVNTNDVASYQIWRSALGGEFELIDVVPAGEQEYIDTTVESGVPYTYAVTAVDAAENSSAPVESLEVSFGPPGKAETELPPDVAEPVVQVQLRITSKTLDEIPSGSPERVIFETDFRSAMAALLNIHPDRIIITEIIAGSVIVEFTIAEDPAGVPAADVVAELTALVENDPQAFEDAGIGTVGGIETAKATDIAFGTVEADTEATSTLSYSNSSSETDAILSVSASVTGVGFAVAPGRLSLTNGQSGDLVVSFSAADVGNVNGDYSGTLTIITNDPENKLMVVGLTATVTGGLSGAVADVSTQTISFPRTVVDSFSSRDLIISNKGGLPLGIVISLVSDDGAFSISDEGTFSLAGGESKTIEVLFAPTAEVQSTGTITVVTDDPAHPQFNIALSGTGSPEGGPPRLLDENGNEIFGDFDGDASVTFDDFFQFADNFGLNSASPTWDPAFDLDSNEQVNFDDFFIFADNFGKSGTYEVVASTELVFTAELDAAQEGGTSTGTGSGIGDFTYTDDGGLVYEIIVDGLSGAITAAHFHNAAAGTNGSPVHDLTFTEESAGVWVASGTWDSSNGLTPALIDELKAGRLYVNVHTAANPSGELRGQIIE